MYVESLIAKIERLERKAEVLTEENAGLKVSDILRNA